jgi:hypothetical protein
MSILQLKEALHLRIEQVDERFLKVIYAMMETYLKEQEDAAMQAAIENTAPGTEWQPLTEDELLQRLEEALTQYKSGDFKSIDEVIKDVEKW